MRGRCILVHSMKEIDQHSKECIVAEMGGACSHCVARQVPESFEAGVPFYGMVPPTVSLGLSSFIKSPWKCFHRYT